MGNKINRKPNSIKRYILRSAFIPFVFRALTLLAAFLSILYAPNLNRSWIDNDSLLKITGAVAFLVFIPSINWHPEKSRNSVLIMIAIEFCLCSGLLFVTGSESSPFILYSFTPVLTSALFLSRGITYTVGGLLIAIMVCSGVINPLYEIQNVPLFLSQLSLYIVAVCLTATLPYLVNVNVRQILEEENIRAERKRLSREIHDGVAQTLHALCWQVQILRRQKDQNKSSEDDLIKLDNLAQKARHDILESLQVLRNVDNAKGFTSALRESVEKLKQESNIEVFCNLDAEDVHLQSHIELEMMRICQEALNNIRKHSGARTVQVDLKKHDTNLLLTIEDDGCGFDAVTFYRPGTRVKDHHGLSVMQERAEAINGKLWVISWPQRGTEIKLEVPCELN